MLRISYNGSYKSRPTVDGRACFQYDCLFFNNFNALFGASVPDSVYNIDALCQVGCIPGDRVSARAHISVDQYLHELAVLIIYFDPYHGWGFDMIPDCIVVDKGIGRRTD